MDVMMRKRVVRELGGQGLGEVHEGGFGEVVLEHDGLLFVLHGLCEVEADKGAGMLEEAVQPGAREDGPEGAEWRRRCIAFAAALRTTTPPSSMTRLLWMVARSPQLAAPSFLRQRSRSILIALDSQDDKPLGNLKNYGMGWSAVMWPLLARMRVEWLFQIVGLSMMDASID